MNKKEIEVMRIRNAFEESFCLPSILTNNDIIFT